MTDSTPELTPGAQALLDSADGLRAAGACDALGVHHVLVVFLERYGPMAEDLSGVDAADLLKQVRQRLGDGDGGQVITVEELAKSASERAALRGAPRVNERDIGAAALAAAGINVVSLVASSSDRTKQSVSAPVAGKRREAAGEAAGDDIHAPKLRTRRKTPLLDEIGRDLTQAAAEGKLPPVVGRDDQVRTMIETLCRVTKRNPVLLGPAGVGKTAIVEGLAQKIVAGEVPEHLSGVRLIEIKTGVLVSGTGIVGKLEERMTQLLAEAADPDVILFMDEIHSILGSGGGGHGMDVAGLLKPALARDDLALIGATTDMEYRRILDQDAALERRFQPVHVPEMDRAQALDVLKAQRDRLAAARGVAMDDGNLEWLVVFADDFMRNRHFPDKAIDLLEQCMAHAMVEGKDELDLDVCQRVAQQLIGMPLSVDERLTRLRARLESLGILQEEDIAELVGRLQLTMGSHDFSPERPNAILLLTGEAVEHAELLAAAISDALYGSPQRVITIDLAGYMDHDESAMTRLLGVPYGYVGAELSRGAIQQIGSQPWSSVLIKNVDKCGWLFVNLVVEALESGHFVDAHGTYQYLSDAVVILTADTVKAEKGRPLGFVQTDSISAGDSADRRAEKLLGPAATALCQVIAATPSSDQAVRGWLSNVALPGLAERYRRDGLEIGWDPTVIDWLAQAATESTRRDSWMTMLEEALGPLIVELFRERPPGSIVVARESDALVWRPADDSEMEGE